MNTETNPNLLKDIVENYEQEKNVLRNKNLGKMIDIFLLAFVILILFTILFSP